MMNRESFTATIRRASTVLILMLLALALVTATSTGLLAAAIALRRHRDTGAGLITARSTKTVTLRALRVLKAAGVGS